LSTRTRHRTIPGALGDLQHDEETRGAVMYRRSDELMLRTKESCGTLTQHCPIGASQHDEQAREAVVYRRSDEAMVPTTVGTGALSVHGDRSCGTYAPSAIQAHQLSDRTNRLWSSPRMSLRHQKKTYRSGFGVILRGPLFPTTRKLTLSHMEQANPFPNALAETHHSPKG
jgi:hypothetical protein